MNTSHADRSLAACLPGHGAGHEQHRQPAQRDERDVEPVPHRGQPQQADGGEHQQRDPLRTRQRSHLLQLVAREGRRFWRVGHFGTQHAIGDPRHDQAGKQPGHDRGGEPARRRDFDVHQLEREVGAEEIAGLAGDEHRARHRRPLIHGGDQERAQALSRLIDRMRIKKLGDAAANRQHHAGAARGDRRHAGGQRDVGHLQRVGHPERRLADQAHEQQRDAPRQAAVEHHLRDHHRHQHQPHRRLGETAQHLAHRRAVDGHRRQADQHQGRGVNRLGHHPGDHANEDGGLPPALGRDAGGDGNEVGEEKVEDDERGQPAGARHSRAIVSCRPAFAPSGASAGKRTA